MNSFSRVAIAALIKEHPHIIASAISLIDLSVIANLKMARSEKA